MKPRFLTALAIAVLIGLLNSGAAATAPLEPKALEGKDLEQLYLMRNEIYARHGRPFKTHELDLYSRSQSWYRLDLQYSDARLTATDQRNIALIRARELALLEKNYLLEDGRKSVNFPNLINKRQFASFTRAETDRIARNGFVVMPARHEQFFHLYEDNSYKGIASFITTDAVLQLYHVFFDFTLRNMETERLAPLLATLNRGLLQTAKELYGRADNGQIKEAARRNLRLFRRGGLPVERARCRRSIPPWPVWPSRKSTVARSHATRAESLIFAGGTDQAHGGLHPVRAPGPLHRGAPFCGSISWP